jgi:hypothetical protein
MRRIAILVASISALACAAAPPPAGRWEGRVHIPGRDLTLVVDLAQDAAGAWIGSMVIPGFDVKGAPLGHLKVNASTVAFDAGNALGVAPDGPATFTAHLDGREVMQGELRQGGNTAAFTLRRAGEAQVELPPRSTAVAREVEGKWVGEYEFGGYPRHVTVDIANHGASPATAEFVVVGKRETRLPIDLVAEDDGVLRIECSTYQIVFEGRIHDDTHRIDGTFVQGPYEVPLVLRRPQGSAS